MGAGSVEGACSDKGVPELSPEGPPGLRQAAEDNRGYCRQSEARRRGKEKHGAKRAVDGGREGRLIADWSNNHSQFKGIY